MDGPLRIQSTDINEHRTGDSFMCYGDLSMSVLGIVEGELLPKL